ncbi:MAG TPA: helix-turn-helix domain-containing protein [Solirubrobacterales bacterium]|nr:helix-turn-helix domain-containing protein [Solirubrobacterales bacterium]
MSSSSRPEILRATRTLIAKNGAQVSLAEVASEAGVSRQAVYMHFGSRAGLLVALVRNMDEEAGIRQKLERALLREDPVEAFRQFVKGWLRYAAEIQPVASMLFAAREVDPAAAKAWEDRSRELRAGFRAATARLGKAGMLRDGLSATSAASLSWAICSVPVVEQLALDQEWSKDRVARQLTEAALSAITG